MSCCWIAALTWSNGIGFAFCAFLTGLIAWITCQPKRVWTGCEIWFVFNANAAASNGATVLMQLVACSLQMVRRPPLVLLGSIEYLSASFAKSAPPFSCL